MVSIEHGATWCVCSSRGQSLWEGHRPFAGPLRPRTNSWKCAVVRHTYYHDITTTTTASLFACDLVYSRVQDLMHIPPHSTATVFGKGALTTVTILARLLRGATIE
ncbi:hypothetical protein CBL_14358 [Carabus blaptoides fortunei]